MDIFLQSLLVNSSPLVFFVVVFLLVFLRDRGIIKDLKIVISRQQETIEKQEVKLSEACDKIMSRNYSDYAAAKSIETPHEVSHVTPEPFAYIAQENAIGTVSGEELNDDRRETE